MFQNGNSQTGTYFNLRLAVDLGIPVLSVRTILKRIQDNAGKDEDYNHAFHIKVKQMLDSGDKEGLIKEKIVAKLL